MTSIEEMSDRTFFVQTFQSLFKKFKSFFVQSSNRQMKFPLAINILPIRQICHEILRPMEKRSSYSNHDKSARQ